MGANKEPTAMPHGTIFKIKRYALHDGPGIRTTVFLKGCPLSCRWCHNPEGIDPHPQVMSRRTDAAAIRETVGRVVDVDEMVRTILRDQLFYDQSGGGVTFSGGEPLFQPRFLEALLAACNRSEIHAALDTSGFAPPEVLDRLLPRLQLVLCDLKVMDDRLHRAVTGVSNAVILDNLRRMASSSTPLRVRIPLVPGISDEEANIQRAIDFIGTLNAVQGVDLLPFHRIGAAKYRRLGMADPLEKAAPILPERLAAVNRQFESAGFNVTIGG
jgi:pyruvate formate lyase activating enzyme